MSQEPSDKSRISPADAFAAISRGNPKASELTGLSGLSKADAKILAQQWPTIPEDRRIGVVRQVEEIAESQIQYHFGRFLRIALDDTSAVVRQIAVSALWEDDGRDLIDRFIRLMEDDESIDVRAQAATGLGLFAELAMYEEIDEEDGERIRLALLSQATSEIDPVQVTRRALESLAIYGSTPEVESLIRDAFDSDDSLVRASAIFAMGRTMDEQWLPTLIDEFESPDSELRFEAARASGLIGHIDAVSGLSDLIADEDTEVRQAAIVALGKIGGQGAIRVLQAYARTAEEADQEAVQEAIDEAMLMTEIARIKI